MVLIMRAFGIMINKMALVSYIIKMGVCILGTSKMIKLKALVYLNRKL